MLYLTSKTLSKDTNQHLQEQQQDVNGQNTFEKQVKRAESLWGNKKQKGGKKIKTGKKAFDEIETKLRNLGKVQGICHYCEHDRATQIEHIYPKSLFPNKTFVWENYLYICGECNKRKWNWCKVFYPPNSTTEKELKDLGILPSPTEDLVIINLRTENPLGFLMLDLVMTFHFLPTSDDEESREYKKAHYTAKQLELNLDEVLVESRKARFKEFIAMLRSCINIRKSQNFDELGKLAGNDNPIDKDETLENTKEYFLNEYKKRIQTSQHPTVWEEIKRQREILPQIKALFEALPEALQW